MGLRKTLLNLLNNTAFFPPFKFELVSVAFNLKIPNPTRVYTKAYLLLGLSGFENALRGKRGIKVPLQIH